MVRRTSGRGGPFRPGPGGLVERPETVGGQLVEPCAAAASWAASSSLGRPRRVDDHVVDQHHPLAPVVEGGQLADDRQDGVGMAEVVRRGVGQVFDLTDHVVAQIADQSGMERREIGRSGESKVAEDGFEGGQHPARRSPPGRWRHPGRGRPAVVTAVPAGRDGGQGLRPTKEYRPQRSPPSTDSRRKPVRSGPHDLEEGRNRGEGVGHQLSPDRDDAVPRRQGVEPGSDRDRPWPRRAGRRRGAGGDGPRPKAR